MSFWGLKELFNVDNLSLTMMALVGFIALCIGSFSSRFLKGDRRYGKFFAYLAALVVSVFVMVSADHLVLFFLSWGVSNFFLTRLMLHKREWRAARESANLALRNFLIGWALLGLAFVLLFTGTGETSISAITHSGGWIVALGALFLVLAAMTQSGLWPFHRWLTSSLNSPTPVSAFMHAGLINGGGFLLARFAPIFFEQTLVLNLIFVLGIVTAIVGTSWKLMQTDIKRSLACSTMGQMGFMVAQCGLGLFPSAIVHLVWHGIFKAYLFLGSGASAQVKRYDSSEPIKAFHFFLALICGVVGAYTFSCTSHKPFFSTNTTLFLITLAVIAGTQFALPIFRSNLKGKLPIAIVVTALAGATYGGNVYFIEWALEPLDRSVPQPLNLLHIIALISLVGAWFMVLLRSNFKRREWPDWMLKLYVKMLNASQPHPKTVTTHRNQYQF
ncbi:MAG: hypothetical protein MRY21_01690 [Simkaniaceae bacterium]|nr:hypothetical protein [Simkaniaceae bacterium]